MKTGLENCEGFEWDESNSNKNWLKHKASKTECEQVFFNFPKIVTYDEKHSESEKRWYCWEKNILNRKLFVVFTCRGKLIRVISARNMNKKERAIYEEENKEIPKFKNEKEEQDFWSTADSTQYIDWQQGKVKIFPKLKPSAKTISIRLPENLIDGLKILANKRDVPYQSLIKIILNEKINKEFRDGLS